MHERDAGTRAEMSGPPRKAGDSIAEDTGLVRQACAAPDEHAEDETLSLMEQVVHRQNMLAAHRRVSCCVTWVCRACSMSISAWRAADEPPYTEPYVRWCGGWGRATSPGYPVPGSALWRILGWFS